MQPIPQSEEEHSTTSPPEDELNAITNAQRDASADKTQRRTQLRTIFAMLAAIVVVAVATPDNESLTKPYAYVSAALGATYFARRRRGQGSRRRRGPTFSPTERPTSRAAVS